MIKQPQKTARGKRDKRLNRILSKNEACAGVVIPAKPLFNTLLYYLLLLRTKSSSPVIVVVDNPLSMLYSLLKL